MKTAGMYVELAQGSHPMPAQSIADNIAAEPLDDLEQIVGYLSGGHILIDMMDIENDVIEPECRIMNGASILTDGEWLWRKDFAYYVRQHNVIVPTALLDAIRQHGYAVPPVPEAVLASLAQEAEQLAF